MADTLRILFVDDSESDAGLIFHQLNLAGYIVDFERVEIPDQMKAALIKGSWNLVFSEYKLEHFDAFEALTICHDLSPDIPFIIITNVLSDNAIISLIKAGAHDYLTKDNLARLIPVVERELNETKIRREKRLSVNALMQNEKRYRNFFEHGITGNYLSTPEGWLIDFNLTFAAMLGYKSDEVLPGINIAQLFADNYNFITIIDKLKEEKNIDNIEHEFICKDGRKITCVENITGIFDEDGKLDHYLGYLIDITARKHTLMALIESELRYRSLFSEMMEGFALHEIICDEKGKPVDYRFLSVNPAFERMTGLLSSNLINKTVKQVMPDTEISWIEKYGQVALTSIPISFEDYSGVLKRFYQVVAFCPKKGQFATIITDITDRKRTEEELKESEVRYRSLFEGSPDAIFLADSETGLILDSNLSAGRLTGKSREELIGMHQSNLHPPGRIVQSLETFKTHVFKSFNKEEVYPVENSILQPNGSEIPVEILASSFTMNDKHVIQGVFRDITVRKNIEKELVNRERKYRELANSLPVSVYETDLLGNLTFANATAYEWFGYEESEVDTGINIVQFIVEKERFLVKERFRLLLTQNLHNTAEYTAKRKDGSHFPVLISSFAVKKDGVVIGVRGTVVDLSEQKLAHSRLKKSEKTLTNLISNLPGFVYRSKNDKDWTMEYLSEGFATITGYSVDDIMEFKKLTFNDIIHPDYRNYLWEQWQILLALKSPMEEEYPIITKSGETRWVWERGRGIFNDDANLIYLEGFITDITDRKRAEQIQKVLYDISTAVLTTQNLGELVEIIRNQLGNLLDTRNFYVAFYDEATDMFHTPHAVDEMDNVESWPAEKSLTGYLIKQKKALLVSAEDTLNLMAAGEIHMVGSPSKLWLGVPLHEEEKIFGAFVVQSYDNPNAYTSKDVEMLEFISHQISLFVQRKRTEVEIKAARVKAEESDRLKSAFLATMNHELRTPLNHILGFSELILSGVMPEENQSFASSIYASGKNLLAIVEDVFDLALAEQANVKLRLQTFRLMDQFMENKSSFDYILQSSGKAEQIQLIFKPDTHLLSMYLTVDRSKVNQVLINLFKNAVKFTNAGTIEFGYQSNEPGKLTFFIKDTGIGIPKEKQALIFDFFRQGDDSPTRVYGGIGIGLAICQKIATILKGELSVTSEPNKGSAFYLTVPVELADVSDPL